METPILNRIHNRDINKIKTSNYHQYIKNEVKAVELVRKVLDTMHKKEKELGRNLTIEEYKEIEDSILNTKRGIS
jgi:hypothetical protein